MTFHHFWHQTGQATLLWFQKLKLLVSPQKGYIEIKIKADWHAAKQGLLLCEAIFKNRLTLFFWVSVIGSWLTIQ